MEKIYLDIKVSKQKALKGCILDISRGGISIACDKKIRKKEIIEIETEKKVFLPMAGEVVSVALSDLKGYKYRLGVKFISTEKRKIEKLKKFINEVEKRKETRLILI
jgi:c-di-GMP-binding flagellar brake protein YcgR